MLRPDIIKKEDLLFTGELDDDYTNVCVKLFDFDWMNYSFGTTFKTADYGQLKVEIFGSQTDTCFMEVSQLTPEHNKEVTFIYEFGLDLFIKHYRKYLTVHMAQWGQGPAFDGEPLIIDFYNDIIRHHSKSYISKATELSDEAFGKFVRKFEKCLLTQSRVDVSDTDKIIEMADMFYANKHLHDKIKKKEEKK